MAIDVDTASEFEIPDVMPKPFNFETLHPFC